MRELTKEPASPDVQPQVSLFQGARWLALYKLFSQILSWGATFYLATVLLPSDYGLAALATAFTGFADIFIDLGIGATLIQRQKIEKKEVDTLFTFTVLLGIFFTGAAIILAYFGGWYFRNPAIIPLTQFTAFIFLASSASIIPYNLLNREMRFKERGLVDMGSVLISISAQIPMAHLGMGAWTLLAGTAVLHYCRLGFSFYYSGYRPAWAFDWPMLKKDLHFSLQIALGRFLLMIKDRGIPIILGRTLSATHLGYLSFAGSLAAVPNAKIVQLLREVLLPLLSRKAASPVDQLQGLFTALKAVSLFITPLFLCGFYYGEDALGLLFGSKWEAMFPVFEALCLAQIGIVYSSVAGTYNIASGKPRYSALLQGLMSAFILLATFFMRNDDLILIAYTWAALTLLIHSAWFWWLFRDRGKFLRKVFAVDLGTVLICVAGFAADWFLINALRVGGQGDKWVIMARMAGFAGYYLAYLRIRHWAFIIQLKKK